MNIREFKPSSWAVDNRASVFVLTMLVVIAGIVSYNSLPKEQFPDIVIPTIYINTFHQGTSPTDIENLITRPIEQELKSLSGVKRFNSSSVQDYSIITVEFLTDVEPHVAKQRVQDAVDKARTELPADLDREPVVQEVDFSEMPIMVINVSGNYDLDVLKDYCEDIQDAVESLKEITRVDMIGAREREVQINVDIYKMQAASVSFQDIRDAINGENVNISGGEVKINELERTLRVVGEFTEVDQIEDLVVRGSRGNSLYLRDIADVRYTYEEQKSFARLDRKPVISLNVIKKSGENLIAASDKITAIVDELQRNKFPQDLVITVTNDQSVATKTNLDELINSVFIGFILVTLVLMFFMGLRNAMFVGLAVPLSSTLSFLVMPVLDYTFNLVVTFSFLLALGIIVDNAIVVIENTYRLYTKERMNLERAAKEAAGEVFKPVLAGTLTTLGPFFPLLFWPGIVGEFMIFLPVILIVSLSASLFVAFIMNPVFAVQFMQSREAIADTESGETGNWKRFILISAAVALVALMAHGSGAVLFGNLLLIGIALVLLNKVFITPVLIRNFQKHIIPRLLNLYTRQLTWAIKGWRPILVAIGGAGTFVAGVMAVAIFQPPFVFFPESDPNFIYTYIEMPQGTRADVTDSITRLLEERVFEVIGEDNPAVKSVIANVGIGAGDPQNPDRSLTPHKGKVTVACEEFKKRQGVSTSKLLDDIRNAIKDIPGAAVTVEKESNGPPTGKPVQLEIRGEEFDELIRLAADLKRVIADSLRIPGIEELKSDLVVNKPEVVVEINRDKANEQGLSSSQIGFALRTALYGDEISQYRSGEDEYPIQLRLDENQRQDLDALLNLRISFREQASGDFRSIPISAVADVYYSNSFGGVNRKDMKRVATLASNVLSGHNANEINERLRGVIEEYPLPSGYEITMGGEQEDQAETNDFLAVAFGFAILLVYFIMVTQFNSAMKPLVILSTVVLSLGGVFLGFGLFGMTISFVMTGVGVVSLAGIVVNNGILLIDFTDQARRDGKSVREAIIEGGTVRFTPVILTAITTMLGLVPLAVGLNVNFESLIRDFDPQFFLGGDNVAFWAPLAWTIIFGLGFSTMLTLFVVPALYYCQHWLKRVLNIREPEAVQQS